MWIIPSSYKDYKKVKQKPSPQGEGGPLAVDEVDCREQPLVHCVYRIFKKTLKHRIFPFILVKKVQKTIDKLKNLCYNCFELRFSFFFFACLKKASRNKHRKYRKE